MLADPPRGVTGVFPAAHRDFVGIIDEDRIDIRRIVEFAAAMLAQPDDRKAFQRRVGIAGRIYVGQRLIQRPVGEIRQLGDNIGESQAPGKITNRQG